MTREEAIQLLNQYNLYSPTKQIEEAVDMAIESLSAEPIERISDNTIVVKYADYEDIGRIILTNGDIFCKMFYEDARQNDDSDYDSLVPDEYKTEPKWNCTANFVAEQLDRLRNMTDEERWDFFIRFFSPSADAEPTVIRAKTFMRKEDFDKWAEDIKRQGENVICIPCDAEVVSADAVHGEWLPIEETLPTYDGGEKTWLTGMKCSNCGKLFDLRVGYYFCPSCGAKMKGGAE